VGVEAAVARVERTYDVADLVAGPGRHEVAVTMVVPGADVPAVLCCAPGGGATGAYFDLPDPAYSFAGHAAAAGLAVIAVDNLGTGRSRSTAGLRRTPLEVAAANARAFAAAARELPGAPRLIGVGHSMGAALTILAQDRWRPFAALAVLGFTTAGLPEQVRGPAAPADRFGAGIVDAAATRIGAAGPPFPFLVDGDTPAAARRAYSAAATAVLPGPALLSMLPGNVADAAAAVDVPVFVGVGDHEPWSDPAALAAQFPAAPAVEVHVLHRAAHIHVLAATRRDQWDRLFRWAAPRKESPP
jgi:alpha-beta hydrolase superfamily lysophospholipase